VKPETEMRVGPDSMTRTRARVAVTIVLGLSAAACTKKPSAEECGRAWQHVSKILGEMAIDDMNRLGADVPDEAWLIMGAHIPGFY
jgi:hypothetical protein